MRRSYGKEVSVGEDRYWVLGELTNAVVMRTMVKARM